MKQQTTLAHKLQSRIRCLEETRQAVGGDVVASGCQGLDRLLPGGGLPRGGLVEWLGVGPGSGAASLALLYARQAYEYGGVLVLLDRQRQIYPPALAAWGVNLDRVVLVHPQNRRDECWAWDQALRCSGVAAVWGWIEQIDNRSFRRFQLSAETSGGLGLLIRPATMQNQPTWAPTRLLIEPQAGDSGRWVRATLLRGASGNAGSSVQLAWDEWTGQLREEKERHETYSCALAAQLARTKVRRRSTGT